MGIVFAQNIADQPVNGPADESGLSSFQKLARSYRADGFNLQGMGKLDEARSLYQKAIELDPTYALAYNDLGVVYEAVGLKKEAESYYLKALQVDPKYLGTYSNLAFLYENQGDYQQSAGYWSKRKELGAPNDPWTWTAQEHLERIIPALPARNTFSREQISEISIEMKNRKQALKNSDIEQSKDYFERAKIKYNRGDELSAYKLACDAGQLDPSNKEIQEFVERLQTRLLSR